MGGWRGMGWGMDWSWLFMALLIVGLVLLVVALVRGRDGAQGSSRRTGRSRAREILDERYARGEMDTADYQDRVQQLGEDA